MITKYFINLNGRLSSGLPNLSFAMHLSPSLVQSIKISWCGFLTYSTNNLGELNAQWVQIQFSQNICHEWMSNYASLWILLKKYFLLLGSPMCTYQVRATKWKVKVCKVPDFHGQLLSFINPHLSGGWYDTLTS